MRVRDARDIVAGGLLVLLGLWIGFHAISNFDIGTPSRMGPGMFPASLGFLLAGLGALIAIPAFFRSGTLPEIHWRPFFFLSIGTLAFALTVTRFGMLPAVALLTVLTVLSDNKVSALQAVLLAAGLPLLAWLIFRLGLGIALEPFRWPL